MHKLMLSDNTSNNISSGTNFAIGTAQPQPVPPAIVIIGYGSDISESVNNATIVGADSKVSKSNCTVVGSHSECTHLNSIVIGNNIKSASENTLYIGDKIFTNNKISIADNQVVIMANNNQPIECHACESNIINGIEWKNDDVIKSSLCFQCKYDTVIYFKNKKYNNKSINHFDTSLDNLQQELNQLKNAYTNLKNKTMNDFAFDIEI